MALDRPHLKAVSDSASLRVVSKLFQKLELKLTDDQWPQHFVALVFFFFVNVDSFHV